MAKSKRNFQSFGFGPGPAPQSNDEAEPLLTGSNGVRDPEPGRLRRTWTGDIRYAIKPHSGLPVYETIHR
jgi:hypothetical protein